MKGNNQNDKTNDNRDLYLHMSTDDGRRKPRVWNWNRNKSGDNLLPERSDRELEALWPDQAASRSFRESIGSEQEALEDHAESRAHSDGAAIGTSQDDEHSAASARSGSDSGPIQNTRMGTAGRQCKAGDEMRDLVYAVIILALIAVSGYSEYRKQETAKMANRVYLKCIDTPGKFADECIEAKMGLFYTIG